MPLSDRPEFRAWLEARTGAMVGRRHGHPTICTACANRIDHQLGGSECLVCLAEQFGTETAELWLAEALAGVIHAAADPPALARILSSIVAITREVSATHVPPDPA